MEKGVRPYEKAGAELRAWRLERGVSQNKLAQAIGMSKVGISLLEQGYTMPRASTIKKLAIWYDRRVGEIEKLYQLKELRKERSKRKSQYDRSYKKWQNEMKQKLEGENK